MAELSCEMHGLTSHLAVRGKACRLWCVAWHGMESYGLHGMDM